ncbi:hypothetical protein SmJEL517_g01816 [Synchytrium microbalum]|uniref:Aldehyde dehydrogenase domain-containing protein n=1 Tax=Synchytrium microbalum TaxID=1806994 RepID=A0A507C8M1_9FUNG|nr:uncharacterized protein SmJEL517_g01816 [Synchytrium microbalum]TPX35972.1 hypothetical protein SmJEL517_g01816 [Synchytrium microbalum]
MTAAAETTVTYAKGSVTVPTGLFINGEFVQSVSGKKLALSNPSDGQLLAEFYEGDAADVNLAVKAAKAAFVGWSKVPPAERGRLLSKLADLYDRDCDLLSALVVLENGKDINSAKGEVVGSAKLLRYYAGWSDKLHGKVVDVDPSLQTYTRHEPFGVVGQIIPWNVPIAMQSWKFGPALACGNCIVMKLSEKTPMAGLYVGKLVNEAGFPPGVVNLINGYGATAGSAMASHMDISKIAFTGSTATGRKIMAMAAASNLKKVSLELGGKSAHIVFKDANIDKAVFWACIGIYANQGQACSAGSRLFVHADIYDEFVEKLGKASQAWAVGDPWNESTRIGAIVDQVQFNRVLGYIEAGKKAGAKVVTGGGRQGDKGFFVQPTVFANVTDDMVIAKEEIFGPVVVALKFTDEADVIERANNTEYGLAAGLHTTSISTAMRVANALQAGSVFINAYHIYADSMPFGGYKQSGIGREKGKYGLLEYQQVKSIYVNLD